MNTVGSTGEAERDADDRIADDASKHSRLYVGLSRRMLGAEAWLRSHGGRETRFGMGAFWAVIALVGVILLIGPMINEPLSLEDITDSASVSDARWIARDFGFDYRLSRDPDGGLRAQVEERITAFFPEGTDETGIERVLSTQYQGHALNPSAVEATLDGASVTVGQSESATRLTLTVGGAEQLQGDHEVVLRYELHNLAYATTDAGSELPVDLLEWDVFGASWPQGYAGLDVLVSMPADLAGALIGQPRGAVAWSLLSAGAWLEPEPDTGADVSFRFSNDQSMPPNAQAWFTMKFEPGTFTMPAPTPLFWLQTFGPLAPLAVLGIILLLAFAARAVAWGDARGRPWFVAQFEPPKNLTPRMAARVLRTPATRELAAALADAQAGSGDHRPELIAAAKVAARAGRLGDWPRAIARYLAASEGHAQLAAGLRRVPRGFIRDLFIAAPLALTIVQWGLVRQLSHQAELTVVWWPVAFVAASTGMGAIILGIALSVRPLTRRGALVKQHLLGIGVYAERTRLLERGEIDDRMLPFAVLSAPPRTAGAQVLTLIEGELGATGVSSGWRTGEFLTWPRILLRLFSAVLVLVAICVPFLFPSPYSMYTPYSSYRGNLVGNLWTEVQSLDVSGELTRTASGAARIDVIERLTVGFNPDGSSVPQFVQQWPNTIDEQDLTVTVESVTIAGEAVPFVTQQDFDTLLMRTTLAVPMSGTQNVEVHYSLGSAAVAAEHEGAVVDSVRWAALLEGWEYDPQWGGGLAPERLRIEFRIADDLAGLATSSGWISRDTSSADDAAEWAPSVVPFTDTASADGVQSHLLLLAQIETTTWPFDFTVDDVGTRLLFPAGTFVGPDVNELQWAQFQQTAPFPTVIALGALGGGLGLIGTVQGFRRTRRAFAPSLSRDLVRWLASAAALASCILFVWTTIDMAGDDRHFAALGLSAVLSLLAVTMSLIVTRASRQAKIAAGERMPPAAAAG